MKLNCKFDILFSISGPLLRTIQMSSLYKDSKTFVDKKLKYPAGKIIKNFETLVNEQNGELLSLEQIKQVSYNNDFNSIDSILFYH